MRKRPTIINTWADSFGRWHVMVDGDIGLTQRTRAARQAIVDELRLREAPGWEPTAIRVQIHGPIVNGRSHHAEQIR